MRSPALSAAPSAAGFQRRHRNIDATLKRAGGALADVVTMTVFIRNQSDGDLDVGAPAVVVSPPLKGARWIVGGGCCTPYSYHRGATLPINGTIHVAERYAIDFVQLNDNKMLYSGPQDQLSSYAFFGTEIHSVADGIVVQIADNLPEQVPGKLPEGATIQMAAGNHVVVYIGEGR